MRANAIVSCCALMLLLVLGCSKGEGEANALRQRAEQALAQGDHAAAYAAISELRSSLPESPEAVIEIASLLVSMGETPRARWELEAGLAEFPHRDDLRLALAGLALELRDPSQTLSVLEALDPLADQYPAALMLRGRALLELGDLEGGISILKEAATQHPEEPGAGLLRITTLVHERRYEEAQQALEEARLVLPTDGRVEPLRRELDRILAGIYAALGEHDAALALFEELVEAGDSESWGLLIEELVQVGRADDALARLEAESARNSQDLDIYPLLASLYLTRNRPDDAEKALRDLADRCETPSGLLPLAEHYSNRGDPTKAEALLAEGVARFPDDAILQVFHTETLLDLERIDDAKVVLDALTKNESDKSPQVEYLRARIDLANGDADAAVRRLTALTPRLDRATTQFWLGQALETLGDSAGARRRYGVALGRDHSWPAPARALLRLAIARSDLREAVAAASALIDRAPHDVDGWLALCEALTHLGETRAAEQAARRSRVALPGRWEPEVMLARAVGSQGRYEEALKILSQVDLEASYEADVQAARVWILGAAGRTDEGIALGRTALMRFPKSARLYWAVGELHFMAGEFIEGTEAIDTALELAPENPKPLRNRCHFYVATRQDTNALIDCQRYLGQRPDDAEVHFLVGVIQTRGADDEAAIESYRRAAELNPQDFRPLNNLATALERAGHHEEALVAAQEAYRLAGENPYVMDTLATLYMEHDRVDRAVSLLEDASLLAPDLMEVHVHLAEAYTLANRPDEARRLLAELIARTPQSAPLRAALEEQLDALP